MKTVRVRAAVAVNPKTGEYEVKGWDGASDSAMAHEASLELIENAGPSVQITWITADIPIRGPQTVEAEVESDD